MPLAVKPAIIYSTYVFPLLFVAEHIQANIPNLKKA